MDVIFIQELKLNTLVGIHQWERKTPQTIRLDLEIGIPGDRAGKSDKIGDTIDYGAVVARIEQALTERHFFLLERLAGHIAQLIIKEFGAPWVKVSVAKLGLMRGANRIGVTIERGRRI